MPYGTSTAAGVICGAAGALALTRLPINGTAYEGGRSAGSLAWAGIDDTFFRIDPRRGLCAVLMMPFLPFVDKDAIAVLNDFERGVYRTQAAGRFSFGVGHHLRVGHFAWRGADVRDLNRALKEKFRGNSFELRSTVSGTGEFGWNLPAGEGKHATVGYANGELFVDRTQSGVTDFSPDFPARVSAPLEIGNRPLELTILVDRSTVEVFAQGGQVAMTNLVYPVAGAQGIEFYAGGPKPRAIGVEGWELKSAWK